MTFVASATAPPTQIAMFSGDGQTGTAGQALAQPLVGAAYDDPERLTIDRKLLIGAVLFGLGWGLSGFCPGPAVASLVFGESQSLVFIASMAVGMSLMRLVPPQK